jgi:hypothetical protein
MKMTPYIMVIVLLLTVIGVLVHRIMGHSKKAVPALPTRGKYITAREVPGRLQEYFEAEYGGSMRSHDEELDVCFRFAKIHQKYDNVANPIDAKFKLYRQAYLGDPLVAAEFSKLLIQLEKIGLDFVAVYGQHASITTQPFRLQLDEGICCEHGEEADMEQTLEETTEGRGGDRRSAIWKAKHEKKEEVTA